MLDNVFLPIGNADDKGLERRCVQEFANACFHGRSGSTDVAKRQSALTSARQGAAPRIPSGNFSAHLHQLRALVQRGDRPRQLRQEPRYERTPGTIRHAQPEDRRASRRHQRAAGEVFILGDDRLPLRQRVISDRSVLRVPEPRILHMLRFVSGLRQHTSPRGRKLRIDQELHAAALMIT